MVKGLSRGVGKDLGLQRRLLCGREGVLGDEEEEEVVVC